MSKQVGGVKKSGLPAKTIKIMASMSATVDAIRNRHKPVKPA